MPPRLLGEDSCGVQFDNERSQRDELKAVVGSALSLPCDEAGSAPIESQTTAPELPSPIGAIGPVRVVQPGSPSGVHIGGADDGGIPILGVVLEGQQDPRLLPAHQIVTVRNC